MKYNMKQRMEMAYHGVDADELENPKQSLPPVKDRMAKLRRYMEKDHPHSAHYKEQMRVYEVLLDPSRKKERNLWQRIWSNLNG